MKRKLSFSYQNQAVNAAKLFFKTIRRTLLSTEQIERPRCEHKLPNVLSKQKHRTMLDLVYASGLNRGELLGLKPKNISADKVALVATLLRYTSF
jgi:integrase/recombinase XerD